MWAAEAGSPLRNFHASNGMIWRVWAGRVEVEIRRRRESGKYFNCMMVEVLSEMMVWGLGVFKYVQRLTCCRALGLWAGCSAAWTASRCYHFYLPTFAFILFIKESNSLSDIEKVCLM